MQLYTCTQKNNTNGPILPFSFVPVVSVILCALFLYHSTLVCGLHTMIDSTLHKQLKGMLDINKDYHYNMMINLPRMSSSFALGCLANTSCVIDDVTCWLWAPEKLKEKLPTLL